MYIEGSRNNITEQSCSGRPTWRPPVRQADTIMPSTDAVACWRQRLSCRWFVRRRPVSLACQVASQGICIIYCRLTKTSLHLDDEIWTSPSIYGVMPACLLSRPATGFFCGACARTNGSWQLPTHDWSIAGCLVDDHSTGNVYAPFLLRVCSASLLEQRTRQSRQQ